MIDFRTLGTIDLRRDDGADLAVGQSKRLALLAYLATATPPGPHRRDVLLALFWPELPADQARPALRQAVHYLRQRLGPESIVAQGDEALALDPAVVRCDAAAFDRAVATGDDAAALALYRGEFLPGLFVQGAPQAERWLDEARAARRATAAAAAARLADDPTPPRAVRLERARRAHQLAPDDERALRRFMALAAESGDATGALRAYEAFARRIADELGAEPSAETRAAAEEIRRRSVEGVVTTPLGGTMAPRRPASGDDAPAIEPPPAAVAVANEPPHRPPLAVRLAVLSAVVAVLAAVVALAAIRPPAIDRPPAPVARRAGAPGALVARRFYEEGLRAMNVGDRRAALRLFESALAEDPAHTLAAYYAADQSDDQAARDRYLALALRLADRDDDEQRLLVRGMYHFAADDPNARFLAETLAIRYPRNADGQLLVGKTRVHGGDFLGAIAPLRRAIALDSAGLAAETLRCRACDAYAELAAAYDYADSMAAAERTAREWLRARPRSGEAWSRLAYRLEIREAYDSALDALRAKAVAEGRPDGDVNHTAETLMRAGDFGTADVVLRNRLRAASREGQADAWWLLTLSLRNQGRYADALDAARRFRRLAAPNGFASPLGEAYLEALVLQERGEHRAAAAIFDSIAHEPKPSFSPARRGRLLATFHAHRATALALAGDTAALRALVDSVRDEGARSGFERDRRLHHYVRGLLFTARGDDAAALDAYRQSMFSPLGGWARSNLEAGRAALRSGRPADAAYVLGAAIRGPYGASGLWISRTETHLLLGEAWERMGQADSARKHYQRVADAWRDADPPLRARRTDALRRLARLGAAH